MRKIVYDYGVNFTSRHKIYITSCMVVSIACFTLSLTHERILQNTSAQDLTILQWALIPTGIFYGLQFVLLIRKCQEINENFDTHLELIRENQSTYQTIHHFRDYYVQGNSDLELPFDVNLAFTTAPRSQAHVRIIEQLKSLVGSNLKQLDEYAEKLVEM